MSDKISLEHLIRNIAEGKFTPSDEPKINLEHTIKNVMVDEGWKLKDAKKVYDYLTGMWKTVEKSNLPATIEKEKDVVGHKINLPSVAPETKTNLPTGVSNKTSNLPATRVPAEPPATAPSFPLAKPETTTATAVATATTAALQSNPKTATATKTATPTQTPTDTKTVEKPTVAPKVAPVNPPETQVAPKPDKKAGVPTSNQPPANNAKKTAVPKGYVGKGKSIPHFYSYDVLHRVPVNHHLSFAMPEIREENERKNIENVPRSGDRHDLEYVGRKKKNTLARNASVKNVVSEGKKLADVVKKTVNDANKTNKTKVFDNPPVIINPDLNKVSVTEGSALVKAATSPGALSVGLDAPSVIGLAKRGEYKKALSAAGTALVGGALTATPGVGTFLSAMEPTPAGEGEDELTKRLTAKPKTLAPGEGIKLSKKPAIKTLAPGEGIKLQPKKPN